MKKLFTLCLVVMSALAVNAQMLTPAPAQAIFEEPTKAIPTNLEETLNELNRRMNDHVQRGSDSRASTESFFISYLDEENRCATDLGTVLDQFVYDINRGWNNADNLNLDYAWVFYDRIMDFANDVEYPLTDVDMTIDSLVVVIAHENLTGTNNQVVVTIYDRADIGIVGTAPNEDLVGTTPLFTDTLNTTTSLTAGPLNTGLHTVYPNLNLGMGNTFIVRVDYFGDTTDKFRILGGGRDDCADACSVEEPCVGFTNTWYRMNYVIPSSGTDISGINSIGFDCDMDGTVGTPGSCEQFSLQNAGFIPYISATVELGGAAVANPTSGCEGDVVSIDLDYWGSNTAPPTYSWTPTTGLSCTTCEDPMATVGATDQIYTCTITDGANTTTVNVTVESDAIGVNAGADQAISCGNTANLLASASGDLGGVSYNWSNGVTTFANNGVDAGAYSVTVTNAAGCSSTDNVIVSLNGVNNNNVDFAPANPPLCATTAGFNNLTARKTGWSWTWNYVETSALNVSEDASFTMTAGTATISLTADSAGCEFSKTNVYTVLAAGDPACVTAIEDNNFAKNISLFPNPSTGLFNLNVEGLEEGLTVNVYDVEGKVIFTENVSQVTSYNKVLDLSSYSNGIYLVKLQSGDKVATKRITVSK